MNHILRTRDKRESFENSRRDFFGPARSRVLYPILDSYHGGCNVQFA